MLEVMTYENYEKLLAGPLGEYYVGRWEYFKEIIDIIKNHKVESALELRPGKHTIVKNYDIMVKPEDDAWGRSENPVRRQILHNATEKPWPIKDKEYDLFVATQVWEHLDNKQARAFREVMRVSKMAALSFPIYMRLAKR